MTNWGACDKHFYKVNVKQGIKLCACMGKLCNINTEDSCSLTLNNWFLDSYTSWIGNISISKVYIAS